MTELNSLPVLSPAFNRSLLKLESSNINNEKYSYILDILLNKMVVQSLADAVSGFPEYSGNIALWSTGQAQGYNQGDTVVFFDTVNNTNTGIYQVLAVPNNDVVILDALFSGVGFFLQTAYLYKIYRSKLPSGPDGTATFNANSFATGIVTSRFSLSDFGMFNVFENFTDFRHLSNEEYYQPISGSIIGDQGGIISMLSPSRLIEIGSIVQLIQESGSTYNGTWEVIDVVGGNLVLSASYVGAYLGAWVLNVLPKDVLNPLDHNDVSIERYAFNGALKKHEVSGFVWQDFDATTTQPCKFLTTIPNETKVRVDSKGYIQFFQSDKLSCSQYVIDVTDSNNVIQQYIVNLQGVNDEMLGLSVGAGDLNFIPALSFDTVPARGLPVIQECDKSYEVYLFGTTGCGIGGVQVTDFSHPLGLQVLNQNYWNAQQWGDVQIQINTFEIGGLAQAVFPTGNVYTPNDFTSQLYELIYANELDIQSGGILGVVAPASPVWFANGFQFSIDFDQDFYLKMRIIIDPLDPKFSPPIKHLDIEYIWDATLCETSYLINGQELNGAFFGLQGGGVSLPIELSERKKFVLDWSCCTYTGARLIFEDRLGSFAGFNFTLKRFDDMTTSTDGFEVDSFDIDSTSIDRGFNTIQSSYTHKVTINSDFIREQDMTYLQEAFSSPNVFIQYEGRVEPCVVIPSTKRIETKENTKLIQVSMELQVNGTNFSQRN